MARHPSPSPGTASAASDRLARLLVEARKRSRLTQQEAATRAHISTSTLRNLERSRSPEPGFFVISRLAGALLGELEELDERTAHEIRHSFVTLLTGSASDAVVGSRES